MYTECLITSCMDSHPNFIQHAVFGQSGFKLQGDQLGFSPQETFQIFFPTLCLLFLCVCEVQLGNSTSNTFNQEHSFQSLWDWGKKSLLCVQPESALIISASVAILGLQIIEFKISKIIFHHLFSVSIPCTLGMILRISLCFRSS